MVYDVVPVAGVEAISPDTTRLRLDILAPTTRYPSVPAQSRATHPSGHERFTHVNPLRLGGEDTAPLSILYTFAPKFQESSNRPVELVPFDWILEEMFATGEW